MQNTELISNIEKQLEILNYNFSYKGTKYLVEAIYIVAVLKRYYNYSLEKDIYPIIAKKYKEPVNNIKCNISNATDKMYYDCDERLLRKYIGDYEFSKPGAKKIVGAVLKHI